MQRSVDMPHSGHDEEEPYRDAGGSEAHYEGKEVGATDLCIRGDINIELKFETTGEDLQGLDGIDWYGMFAPECRGGGEAVVTCEKIVVVTAIDRI